jgi:hypothetical protein
MEDIAATIAWLAERDPSEANGVTWDLMQEEPVTLGGVIDQFRRALGTGEWPRVALPAWLLDLGAKLGDLASLLGWMPPMRTTDGYEHRRADRVSTHRGTWTDCGDRGIVRLPDRRGDPDARPLDRAAGRAGEDLSGYRADAGSAAHLG